MKIKMPISIMLLSNNSRRMHGLPTHRKLNAHKRFYTRNEPTETIRAFLDYCDGKYDEKEVISR